MKLLSVKANFCGRNKDVEELKANAEKIKSTSVLIIGPIGISCIQLALGNDAGSKFEVRIGSRQSIDNCHLSRL